MMRVGLVLFFFARQMDEIKRKPQRVLYALVGMTFEPGNYL